MTDLRMENKFRIAHRMIMEIYTATYPGGPIKTGPFCIFQNEYLKINKDIYTIFCTYRRQCILNMSIHTRFSSNFISYNGAIWQILTTSIIAALLAVAGLHSRSITQVKLLNGFKSKAVADL